MSRIWRLFVIAAAAILTLSIGVAAPKPAVSRVVTVSERDSKVRLTVGDTLAVRLQSTPSTGYGWQVTSYDARLLKQMGSAVTDDSGKRIPGAPQHQVFRFKALAAGDTALELHYVRPWEKGKPPARVYKASLHISKTPRPGRK